MPTVKRMNAEQFHAAMLEKPDVFRWSELVRGRRLDLGPPSDVHGAVLMNLGRAIGAYFTRRPKWRASFNTLFVTRRKPDTVRCPSICVFPSELRFVDDPLELTESPPALIAEIVSSSRRRDRTAAKLAESLSLGVQHIWVIDPDALRVSVHRHGAAPMVLEGDSVLSGGALLRGFQLRLSRLFKMPRW